MAVMSLSADAPIWVILGWALLGGAAVAVLWCIVGNIGRWRRRPSRVCPRCDYDLSYSPGMMCSECGFTARCESQLKRFRPRWRMALLSLALLPMSSLAFRAPGIAERGWVAAIPTTALVLISDSLEYTAAWDWDQHKKKPLSNMSLRRRFSGELLHERLRNGRSWRWQRKWFASRIIDHIEWNGIAYLGNGRIPHTSRYAPPERILQDLVLFTDVEWSPVMRPLRDRFAREMVSVYAPDPKGKAHIGLNDSRWMFAATSSELRLYLNDSTTWSIRRSRGPSGVG